MSNRYAPANDIDINETNNTHSSLVRLAGTGGRVLELGAASGYMTAALKARDNYVVGVEIDLESAAELATIANEAVVGDLLDPTVRAQIVGPFDAIVAGDLLEHLPDPALVLSWAVGLLAPGGSVVLSVPNVGHVDLRLALMMGRFDYQPTGLLDETHLRFFTYTTLLDLLAEAGLVPIEVERTTIRPFESEIALTRDEVADAVLEAAMAIPESETYQFVVKAVMDDGHVALHEHSAQVLAESARESADRQRETASTTALPLSRQLAHVQALLAEAEWDRDQAREDLTTVSHERDELAAALAQTRLEAAEDVSSARAALAKADAHAEQLCLDLELLEEQVTTARSELQRAAAGERRSLGEAETERARADDLARRLDTVERSRSYRISRRFAGWIVFVLPVGSRRRRFVGRLGRVIR